VGRGVVNVWPEPPRPVEGATEVTAVVEWPFRISALGLPRRQTLWIRIPAGIAVSEGAVADAFLLATTFGALRRARALHVHGTVTRDLLAGVGRLAALWASRDPRTYREVDLRADATTVGRAAEGPPVLCFSGGLDSTYSLARRARPEAGAPLGAALMVRGADIPVTEEAAFATALARARRITDSRGILLIEAATNLRAVKQKWTHSYVPAFAAVMNLLRSRFGLGLLAVGFTHEEARTWWPMDDTDIALVSSSAFAIEGDGYEANRQEKMAFLRDWPEARENLRVCYRRDSWTANCGACLKCVVARLMARAALDEVPPSLPDAPPLEDVRAVAAHAEPIGRLRLEQIRRHARARGLAEPWLDEIDRVLDAQGPPPRA
jgi:hypothetical protein